jgi:hypothetical protein
LKPNHSPDLSISLFILLGMTACNSSSGGPAACSTGLCLDVSVPSVCDPTMMCAEVNTCDDGQLYPTACGPRNCDEPLGPCTPVVDSGAGPPPRDARADAPGEAGGHTDGAGGKDAEHEASGSGDGGPSGDR